MRDLLTPAECEQLRSAPMSFNAMLQAAARLGAERERERAARVCEQMDLPCYPHKRGMPSYCAAAIRRGEEE